MIDPAASFDPAAHPVIASITTEQASYAPGLKAAVRVTLRPHQGLRGTLRTRIFVDDRAIVERIHRIASDSVAASMFRMVMPVPATVERGYRIAVDLRDARGAVLDAASGAIDVQNGTIPTRFPRQCWVSRHGPDVDADSLVASLVAWKCNTIQHYASYYRPEMAPPPDLAQWSSLSNLPINRTTIQRTIAAAHRHAMPVLFFQATGEAYDDFTQKRTGPTLAMGSFRRACSLGRPCGAADLDRSPLPPEGWRRYGWRADHLVLFDPCDPAWQRQLIDRSLRPMMKQFAYDGWQADTLGAPTTTGGITYRNDGTPVDTSACLPNLAASAARDLGKPVIVNTVSGWGMAGFFDSPAPYLYRETWDHETPFVPGLNGLMNGPGGIGRRTSKAVVMPGYINRALAEACATEARRAGCEINGAAARIATAAFAIAGGTWMNHADQGCIVSNIFIEGPHLPCSERTRGYLLTYKTFEVAYQHLLRGPIVDSSRPAFITGGAKGSAIGAAGEVYVVAKGAPGAQIVHLLNLTGVASNDWSDLDGTRNEPTALRAITIRMHHPGAMLPPGGGSLWSASPDQDGGAAHALHYGTGVDASGSYVEFVLPSLAIWTMVVLKLGTVP